MLRPVCFRLFLLFVPAFFVCAPVAYAGPEHVYSAADSLWTTSGREERADEAVLRQRQLRNTDLIIALMGGVLLLGGLTGLFMILVARPAAVFLSLLPFRKFTTRARLYVSWVGLRGAVPIIFATYPVVAGVEDSSLLFNIVFFVTLLSLVVQGTTVSLMAEWLGLAYPERERIFNDEVMNRMLDDATTELTVTEAMLESGHHLRDIVLPAAPLVVMVARDGAFFVHKGNSVLRVGDRLRVVTENKSEVRSVVAPQE